MLRRQLPRQAAGNLRTWSWPCITDCSAGLAEFDAPPLQLDIRHAREFKYGLMSAFLRRPGNFLEQLSKVLRFFTRKWSANEVGRDVLYGLDECLLRIHLFLLFDVEVIR